jgi:hypothetical protein
MPGQARHDIEKEGCGECNSPLQGGLDARVPGVKGKRAALGRAAD